MADPLKKHWLSAPLDNHRYLTASMHEGGYIQEPAAEITGLILVQDCNMAGTYYRMVYWRERSDKSYFTVTGWDSEKELTKMELGEVVTNKKTGLLYRVVQKPNTYIAILERK